MKILGLGHKGRLHLGERFRNAFKSRTSLNILANFIGRSWAGLMTLVFVPVYVKFMGVESYGLVGLFVTLKALSGFMDLGFSTTLNRELARLSDNDNNGKAVIDTVRTIETIYWGLALLVLTITSALSPIVATYWINSQGLSDRTVKEVVRLMGVVVTLSFPFALYTGGLMGLQRQVTVNIIYVIIGVLRAGGAAAVLWLVSPTVRAFFIWQAGVAAVETAVTMACLWHVMPGKFLEARLRISILRRVRRFAAGMTGIGISNVLISQIDKILLVKLLPLKTYGYYTIAVTIAAGLQSLLVYPVSNAVFPRLSQLVKRGQVEALADFYHRGCQLVMLLVIPIGVTVVLFAFDILFIWSKNMPLALNAHIVLSVIMAGYVINSSIIMPYLLQLAEGWTGLTLRYNIIAALVLIPALILGVHYCGVVGGSIVVAAQSVCYLTVVVPLMHRKLLPEEKGKWFLNDFCLPVAAGALSGVALWLVATHSGMPAHLSIGITLIGVGCFVVLVSGEVKSLLMDYAERK